MAILDVLKMGNPILNQVSKPVNKFDNTLKKLSKDMIDTMIIEEGIGLAAPQVGQSIRMIVIDMALIDENLEPVAYVNPEIVEKEGEFVFEEGCLSVPGIREEVDRYKHIRVNYQDIDGNPHNLEAEDLLAVVFQHEIDHLDGILFVQKLSPLKLKLLKDQIKQIKEKSVY